MTKPSDPRPDGVHLATRCGSEDTCTTLVLETLPWLERWVQTQTGVARLGGEDTEDLLQEICVEVLSARGPARPSRGAPGRSWVRTVARRLVVDRVRHWSAERREAGRVRELEQLDPMQAQTEPIEVLEAGDLARQIETHLKQLPAFQQRVLRATLAYGLPVDQVAEREGCSPNSVRLAKSRGLRRLRTWIES